jgi:hypothetical protein
MKPPIQCKIYIAGPLASLTCVLNPLLSSLKLIIAIPTSPAAYRDVERLASIRSCNTNLNLEFY